MGTTVTTGTIPFKGYETWYQRVTPDAAGDKAPLLTFHGGPGACHNYLKSLDGIAEQHGREVIYYDQLGCGNSPTDERPDLWCIDTYVQEVDVVREALRLDRVHLLGQSWGGMLAQEYALTQPDGVLSMVVASSLASIPLWQAEAVRLIKLMAPEQRDVLLRALDTGDFTGEAFEAATKEYVRRHEIELEVWPDYVEQSFSHMSPVYPHMWGPEEFVCTGTLADWDITDRIGAIKIPTLVTTGVQDEATPYIAQAIAHNIPGARLELIPGTHLCHVEHPAEYNALVDAFLGQHD
ncbi:MAG: proline iminopeptidase-family hydrolase [Actinomycetes bacterium]|jgi:proline-specific peptidase|nr:proline iminopeptidase-family hydrolase [Actinomycetes bacterium]